MRFETKEEQIHPAVAAPALVKEVEPVVSKNEVKEAKEAVAAEVKEEVEEAEQEEKRKGGKEGGRRRRKKHGSEDPEEGAGGHRVVICDDQVVSNLMLSKTYWKMKEDKIKKRLYTIQNWRLCYFFLVQIKDGINQSLEK